MYEADMNISEMDRIEKMLDEILHDLKVRHLRCLRDGDQFGEQALLREHIRTASVRCTEDTHLAYISDRDFKKIYENIMKVRFDRRIQFLKAIPLFSSLSKHFLQKMTGMFQRNDFIRNQYVFHQTVIGHDSIRDVKKAYQANDNSFANFQFIGGERRKLMARYLYIIGKGEFEISIKTQVGQEKEAKPGDLIGFLRPQQCQAVSNPSGPVK